jgi:Fe-S cluster assembly iron-binding protein IscA
MIKVSEIAAEKFEEVKQKSNKAEGTMLRVSYGGYG